MSKKVKKKEKQEQYTVKNALVNYYLLLMLTAFPLFYTDQHLKIRHDKLYLFYGLSGILITCIIMILLIYFFDRNKNPENTTAKWYMQLSVTDYAFGAFVLCSVFSTVLSKFPSYAFWGIMYSGTGRNNGLLLIFCYFLVYIIISRAYQYKEYVFIAGAFCAIAVYVLAILHYFYIDPLGMYNNYTDRSVEDFMSTIGNKNLVSCFCCLTVPLFAVLSLNKDRLLKALYFFAASVGFAAMMCADSDSGPLGLIPVMAIVLLFYIRDAAKVRDFAVICGGMLLSSKAVWIVSLFCERKKGLGPMQDSVINGALGWIMLAVFAAAALILSLILRENPELQFPKLALKSLAGAYITVAAALIGFFVYFTFIDKTTVLDGAMKLLRFDDSWGTHRGFMWIRSWEIFKGFDLKDKLFGCGPDTFYAVFLPYFGELDTRFGDASTNCAHNEFINYLITTGIFGLTAYAAVFVSALIAAFRSASKNFLALAFASPVLCYLIQSSVNIATPIVTPLLFIFLALTVNITRRVRLVY